MFWGVIDVVHAEVLANVIIGIAVIETPQVKGILRNERAEVGLEVEGQESAVGNLIQSVAPGVIGLYLQRGEPPSERDGQAVVIGHGRAADLRNRAVAGIDGTGGKTSKGTDAQSRGTGRGTSGLKGQNGRIAEGIQARVLSRFIVSMITYVVERQGTLGPEGLLHFEVPFEVFGIAHAMCGSRNGGRGKQRGCRRNL